MIGFKDLWGFMDVVVILLGRNAGSFPHVNVAIRGTFPEDIAVVGDQ